MVKNDPSGHVVAETLTTLMTGTAIGPLLGGVLGQLFGFSAICAVAIFSTVIFSKAEKRHQLDMIAVVKFATEPPRLS